MYEKHKKEREKEKINFKVKQTLNLKSNKRLKEA